ncbi:MAG: helix-turn-helix transcriptional regulator [Treponema sp.]|jgi:transcriptional regulator with XRE-family HTH domain|nr:helix-turn-helix transcriptional regulator [Treponema sp.]
MPLTFGEKIKVLIGRRGLSITDLAKKTGQSPQNMSNKMKRDNFSEKELKEIADVLNCTFKAKFVLNDTGEEI